MTKIADFLNAHMEAAKRRLAEAQANVGSSGFGQAKVNALNWYGDIVLELWETVDGTSELTKGEENATERMLDDLYGKYDQRNDVARYSFTQDVCPIILFLKSCKKN